MDSGIKQKIWMLRKIQSQGIAEDYLCKANKQVVFTHYSPWNPVLDRDDCEDVALRLYQSQHTWWLINYSTEWSCSVNERLIDPQRQIQLNDGDLIEWGLSSWRLEYGYDHHAKPQIPDPVATPAASPEPMAQHLDLAWFNQQHINPQNPFDIIPVRIPALDSQRLAEGNVLTQLYQEYHEALLAPKSVANKPVTQDPFPSTSKSVPADLSHLGTAAQDLSLQDLVAGTLNIDAVLDSLHPASGDEAPWLSVDSPTDILHLFDSDWAAPSVQGSALPELTQREHRIIGIDSHYRVAPRQDKEDKSHGNE